MRIYKKIRYVTVLQSIVIINIVQSVLSVMAFDEGEAIAIKLNGSNGIGHWASKVLDLADDTK